MLNLQCRSFESYALFCWKLFSSTGLLRISEGSIFPSSSFLIAETDIAISPASESEDAHKNAAQTENSMMNGDPMNAPIPLTLER